MQRYPKEVKDFIAANVKGRTAKALAELVNARFGTDFTESKMKTFKKNHGLTSETKGGYLKGSSTLCSPEVQLFIRNNVAGRTAKELAEITNDMFGTTYSKPQMQTYRKNHGLRSGLSFLFPEGHVPPNKGKKGIHANPATEFRKGCRPHNQDLIGTETLKDDGYLWVKVAEPNKWKQKHRILWEAANGEIPRGFCLLFADGDRMNISLDNLILISRSQLAVLNRLDLIQNERALTETGLKIADIHIKMNQRKTAKNRGVHREQRSTN